ncbi:spore coat protein [Priestia aryabhattai]|uniref:Spore coat protein X/V domain-containing protein n=1 Tax=Priestia megaterium TaxID=1404 RepID=A0AAX6BSZ8_PRIMG|nr:MULTISPECIES: spore coat protein [Priestia]MCM2978925.1 spore coat protein [Priestia aryabhattai]MEB4861127.1 spore coat protein [Priestia megaterium]MED3923169.1 spore coat protein [Priestia aryabhattai]MED4008724.1 spore coat protein [Priestia aryabhattai]MED4012626.1 spore coat protein [Priestia aryabhattai]
MSSKKYYSYDVKKKSKCRHKKDDSKKHCKDGCKVDHYESESTEYDYYNSRESFESSESFDAEVVQELDQLSLIDQESDELIWIKDSCDINVTTTDTQAAIGIQVAIQVAIAIVIRIAIGDTSQNDGVLQDLLQLSEIEQTNKQKIYIENSKDVEITTTDTDVALNVQVLLQVLVAIIVLVDVL